MSTETEEPPLRIGEALALAEIAEPVHRGPTVEKITLGTLTIAGGIAVGLVLALIVGLFTGIIQVC